MSTTHRISHVRYNEHLASMEIKSLGILDGKLPARIHGLVAEWAELHQQDLMGNWERMRKTGGYKKIEPLV